MITKVTWSKVLIRVGAAAMLVGAIDPLEGSLLILPGSALVALGGWLGGGPRRILAFRTAEFVLIAAGVAAMFGLSAAGGIGGNADLSAWWGLLLLPYPIGWSLGVWGPGAPRWLTALGIVIGLWYCELLARALHVGRYVPANIAIATVGVATIIGCVYSLWRQARGPAPA